MGPLSGLRILELAGLGPVPYCSMLLSDLGAEVVTIDRPGDSGELGWDPAFDLLRRGRRSIAIDLKHPEGLALLLQLLPTAAILLEGFRPGVAERLGLGPEVCLEHNPRLIYGRMTGWGQEGPLAAAAGHDLSYIALTGALHAIGGEASPTPPLNLVGDFGGGALFLAMGVLAALWERSRSGRGQVIDAAMVDGASSLLTMIHGLRAQGRWQDVRGRNLLDGGAPFYSTYETADGQHVAIAPLEPKFYAELLRLLGPEAADLPDPTDPSGWEELRRGLAVIFRRRTRREWCELLEGSDACFAPVLSLDEAPKHPHMVARETFVEVGGITQPAPAPRFSRTAAEIQGPPTPAGRDTDALLEELGRDPDQVAELRARDIVA